MARYTLPSGTTTKPAPTSETITFSDPNSEPRGYPLTVTMAFDNNKNHKLTMAGFGPDATAFSDGLEIADNHASLTTLRLQLATDWPSGWGIEVDGNALSTDTLEIPIPTEAQVWVLSIVIINGDRITGDPKIKVIRPSS
jgi:hypothetical protein